MSLEDAPKDLSIERRLDQIEESVGLLKESIDDRPTVDVEQLLSNSRYRLVQRIERLLRENLQQVEALLQMRPQLERAVAPLPSSGGWALDAKSILHITNMIQVRQPRLVVETGSGSSSVWLGYACEKIGARLVTLEHDEMYAKKTHEELKMHGLLGTVDCRLAPLEPSGVEGHDVPWYSLAAISDLGDVDMLLVDGPPATVGTFSRYPALPALLHKLSDSCVVLMDDAHRTEEKQILDRWKLLDSRFRTMDVGVPSLGVLSR